MSKKSGRPAVRKFLRKEKDINPVSESREVQKSQTVSRGNSGNSHELQDQINQKLLTLTKSFFGRVDQPGITGKDQKNPVYTHEQYQVMTDGVRLRPIWRIDYPLLRQASYGTSIISAIHTFRVDDLIRFASISSQEGLWFSMEDENEKPDDETRELMKQAGRFFRFMGDKVDGWTERDNLYSVFEMMIRDTLTLDGMAHYPIRNMAGKLIEIKYLDPATIFPTDPKIGYQGDKSIRHVQMIDNQVVETFGPDELIWSHKHNLSDVQTRGWGMSPLESSMLDLSGVINSLKFNRDKFKRQPPPGFMSIQGDVTQDTLDALEVQWQNMVSGLDDSHAIPIIGSANGEVKWTPLNLPNDIVFEKLMQWLVSFVLMAHGMDQAELGLRLLGSQSLAEANQNDKIKASMTRSKKAMLTYFESTFNKLKEYRPEFSSIVVEFQGTDPEDEKDKLAKLKDEVGNYKLIDEIRIEQDLPSLGEKMAELYGEDLEKVKKAGATILNPAFLQHSMSLEQGDGSEGMEGMEGMDEMEDPEGDLQDQAQAPEFDLEEDDDLML